MSKIVDIPNFPNSSIIVVIYNYIKHKYDEAVCSHNMITMDYKDHVIKIEVGEDVVYVFYACDMLVHEESRSYGGYKSLIYEAYRLDDAEILDDIVNGIEEANILALHKVAENRAYIIAKNSKKHWDHMIWQTGKMRK